MAPPTSPRQARLPRRIGLVAFTLFGLGNILGAGIYVLVGKVAGAAGYNAPFAFILAALVAAFAAAVFAELSSRYPVSAGEAVFAQQGLGLAWLSRLVGLLVAGAGILSCATLARGFAAHVQLFMAAPDSVLILLLMLGLATLTCWGITQSVMVAALFTLVEVAGLVLIISSAGIDFEALAERLPAMADSWRPGNLEGLLAGAFLAFFAYLGFEDMVNVAEEVKDPARTITRGIAGAMILSTVLYLLVLLACLNVMQPPELANSDAPLAAVYANASGRSPAVIATIGLFAVLNGMLVQLIMASRVLYGMAGKGWLPAALAGVNSRTRTPITATLVATLIITALALAFPLARLASGTSFVVLGVLVVMCVSLLRIRRRAPGHYAGWRAPGWVPWAGMLGGTILLLSQLRAMVSS